MGVLDSKNVIDNRGVNYRDSVGAYGSVVEGGEYEIQDRMSIQKYKQIGKKFDPFGSKSVDTFDENIIQV